MQLHGEYAYRMDPQGRVALPARYRDLFRAGIYLTRGFDACVWAFSVPEWESYSAKYASMSANSRTARALRRRVFGSTFSLEIDRQGRVLIPSPLRSYAKLEEDVVIVGAGTWLEIWDRAGWEAELSNLDEQDLDIDDIERGEQ